MFLLTKWYLDVVTGDGTALIGYVARLHWRRLRLAYRPVLIYDLTTNRFESYIYGGG